MNIYIVAEMALRAAALALEHSERAPKRAEQLNALADLINVGVVTDAHLAQVNAKLADRHATDADFEEVLQRIEQHRLELHGE